MANRFLSAGIKRISCVFGARSLCSTTASRASAFNATEEPFAQNNPKNRIPGLRSPKKSPVLALQNWVDQGNRISPSELRRIARNLVKSKRYHHALEVSQFALLSRIDYLRCLNGWKTRRSSM
ncbi:pentatricopeptide repeat-containing protein At5g09450, mitochondrial-like isoform X3 [Abrus precatorius]|uniref:Pentatricopeptide repeat-containing protein At5g09450, mitochondrial-like isoform X3 n=1 Tax=Abrus precatorius TaxID=3816 RepID=A0A8B8LIJ1_ABRPR|nr:pentatricopeptide repeat-containing protein At5g09450, mitochondrial-like isoform X3 [Abrus precatorius]